MGVFKDELRQAIMRSGQVPRYELSSHVQYDGGSPEAFLRRLRRDLYGDEPVPGLGQARVLAPQPSRRARQARSREPLP